MFALKVLTLLAFVGSAFGGVCQSDYKKTCIMKSQMGGLAGYMIGGDPCFLYNSKRVREFCHFSSELIENRKLIYVLKS